MSAEILESFKEYKEKNKEFIDLTIVENGKILIQTENSKVDEELANKIISAWDNRDGTISIGELRYIILKSDPLQFAATKPGPGGKQIVGTSMKGKYAFSFIENGPNMNASSVYFQKWIFDKL